VRPVLEYILYVTTIVGGHVQAPWPPEDVTVHLTRLAYRGRVDDGHELFEMLTEHRVEQHLVSVLQRRQSLVPLEVLGLASEVLYHPLNLQLLRDDSRWEEPA